MTARRTRAGASILLAAVGGLALAGGTTATWLSDETVRDVGGVAVTDVSVTTGLELAPQGLALGVAAALGGLLLLLVRGRAQVAVGALLAVAGLAALVLVLVGAAGAGEGDTGGGLLAAVAGAAAVTAAGVLALRPAAPPKLSGRYDLDDTGDEEWRIASSDEPQGAGDPRAAGERDERDEGGPRG